MEGRSDVTYGESAFGRPRYTPAMQNHLLQDDFACVFHPQSHHRKAISDKNHVHSGGVGNMSTWKIMRRDHRNWLLLLM